MRLGYALVCAATILSFAPGCGDDSTAAVDSGVDGGAADGGDAGEPDDNPDEQALRACELEEPCFESNAQMVENRIAHVLLFDCVVRGLAARTPGRYLHLTDSTWTNGSAGARHTLLVAEDGAVLYTRVPYGGGPATIDGSEVKGQRCVLRPPSYFEACATAFEGYAPVPFGTPPSDEAWACAFGNGDGVTPSELAWFESCEELSPLACE